jgi:hypothetical protein
MIVPENRRPYPGKYDAGYTFSTAVSTDAGFSD